MKILLNTGTGNPEYILANGPERGVGNHIGPAGINHDSDIMSQVAAFLGASYKKAFSRGNLETRIQFSISVELADLNAAVDYAFLYPVSLPRSGDLRVIITQDSVTRVYNVPSAVITSVRIVPIWVSLNISYSIVGGLVCRLS